MFKRGPLRFELFEVPNAAPLIEDPRAPDRDNCPIGSKHGARAVPDLETRRQERRAKGAVIAAVVRAKHRSGFFVRANVGNLLEFITEPGLRSRGPAGLLESIA
jgi:methylmalonyl-CoA/ethylmalonyl-CoA epimerase